MPPSLLICASLTTLAIGTYLIWPSRWNVPAHMQLGFALVAYVIPTAVGATDGFSPQLVALCAEILSVGAACYLIGLVVGFKTTAGRRPHPGVPSARTLGPFFHEFVQRRARLIALVGLVGLFSCFYAMGFVPAFANNPLMAKFFRGPYHLAYQRVALPYRLSFYTLLPLIPVLLLLWYSLRDWIAFLLAACATLGVALTLFRAPIATGGLLAIGIWAAPRRGRFYAYLLLVVLAFPIGAGLYKILGVSSYAGANLWQVIASGAPDIRDQLGFFNHFLAAPVFSYGRTFWGGLIPWHYRWNPSVFTLTVVNRVISIRSIGSGGLRLAAPQWGYVAFGWAGAAIVPFLSGLIWGHATKLLRRNLDERDLVQAVVLMTLYTTLWTQLSQFYTLSMYEAPQILVALLLAYPIALSRRDVQQSRRRASMRTWAPEGHAPVTTL
ncbi:MAG TPA: hypothetical protein VE996_06340 [Terriglobales bacterium]|nr:hypothetical protein [Terriglobales bacterium]